MKVLQLLQIAVTMECGDYLASLNELWAIMLDGLGITEEQLNAAKPFLE